MVCDRNRMIGDAATAGIDFGLTLAAGMASDEAARRASLIIDEATFPDP